MYDFHMHTVVSYDGHNTPMEMAQAAVKAGLKEICFTDHLDYQQGTPREVYAYATEAYRAGYDGLALSGLTIRRGTEVGMTSWNKAEIQKDVAAFPYDFVIGSIHFIDNIDIYYP